jgi:hypothetical protein
MRHARPPKQCCWLGSSRYRGRCGHAITNAYCDTNSNRNSDANGDSDAQCYTNSHSYANGHG